MYDHELKVAIAAVREAAVLSQAVQGTISASATEKPDRSPVTVADLGSQALICSRIRLAFSSDPIIAEEGSSILQVPENRALADRVAEHIGLLRGEIEFGKILTWVDHGGHKEYADRFWTLDPIDGTKGFLRGDQYAIALALVCDGLVQLSVVACPNLQLPQTGNDTGVLMTAVRGEGTRIYGLHSIMATGSVNVSAVSVPGQIRFCESVESAHTSHSTALQIANIIGIKAAPIRLDSQAKYNVVAAGEAEVYMRLPSDRHYVENIWDHAAGALLVEEAGGTVTDVHGKQLDFGLGFQMNSNRGVIATNGLVHESLLKAISEVGVR
jgi:HAL2 family 3'(2'),5'-bisphosphate nucleotidase